MADRYSRLDNWIHGIEQFERFVGGLFDSRATMRVFGTSNGHVYDIWVHDSGPDGGFALGVDRCWLTNDGPSFQLSKQVRDRIRDSWRLECELRDADRDDEQAERFAVARGVA